MRQENVGGALCFSVLLYMCVCKLVSQESVMLLQLKEWEAKCCLNRDAAHLKIYVVPRVCRIKIIDMKI